MPLITAHSGCEGTARDSFDSVEKGILYRADAIEVDVRCDFNGDLRITHDRKADQSQFADCVLLRDVFARIQETSLKINCDLKEAQIIESVLALAKQYHFAKDRLMLSGSLSPEQLAIDCEICEQASVFLNVEQIFKYFYLKELSGERMAELGQVLSVPWYETQGFMKKISSYAEELAIACKSLGVVALNLPDVNLTELVLAQFKALSLPLSVWTVNDPVRLNFLLEHEVFNITTLDVQGAKTARQTILGG